MLGWLLELLIAIIEYVCADECMHVCGCAHVCGYV